MPLSMPTLTQSRNCNKTTNINVKKLHSLKSVSQRLGLHYSTKTAKIKKGAIT